MAKQTVKTTTTKKRVKKGNSGGDRVRCNLCGGSGYAPAPYSKKKKSK